MSPRSKVILLEKSQVAPPPNTLFELSHDLTFSDMMFIGCIPNQRLIFYNNHVQKDYFIETIIPNLKKSLSHALMYFPSLAGNCIIPTDSNKPEIRYVEGNSVSFVVAESNFLDFDDIVSDEAQLCSGFYPYLPRLSTGGGGKFPILAVKVTLFPETGFCIGVECQHVAADGCAFYAFMKKWAMLSKFGECESSNGYELLPIYDRVVVRDHTKELDDLFLNNSRNTLGKKGIEVIKTPGPKPDQVRSTFVIPMDDVQRLKNYAPKQRLSQKPMSTFTVVCAYIWTCMVKANNVTNGKPDAEETEHFCCPFDFRGRVEPPIPSNYFGNCIVHCATFAKNGELSGEEGFLVAVERIREAVEKRCQGVFKGLERMIDKYGDINLDRMLWFAGSERLDYYKMDFGWGKPIKFEMISTDSNGAIYLNGCRDGSQVPEIGITLPREKMKVFSEIFRGGLNTL
ncbi:hypothetical protein LIER_12161 [Lithospermum erythrorhizon]|uniref:Uncharacterized protein n=1 Tax=Lithospermum erythrorhizon TaxID=34254 RepID=A0AAV3PRA1_LITER